MNVTNVTIKHYKAQVTIKQHNNECTVTRMLVNKKSCSRTEFLFEYRVIFNSKFVLKPNCLNSESFVNRGLTVCRKIIQLW